MKQTMGCFTQVALPFTLLKKNLKAKEEKLWKNSNIFHHAKILIFPKKIL
jgi:hypothetical protein